MFSKFWEINKQHIRPECPSVVWSQEDMISIVSTIKWFRSFTHKSENSFFSDAPDQDLCRLTTAGIEIANSLLQDDFLHKKLWIFATLSTPFYTWKIMPTGALVGEWSNVRGLK